MCQRTLVVALTGPRRSLAVIPNVLLAECSESPDSYNAGDSGFRVVPCGKEQEPRLDQGRLAAALQSFGLG